ncbi:MULTISPECIES: DUF6418 domain-containing protein [Burkholderia]|uniref:DUF6418 domain-containing protein n=1 Tax=Burkholderia TaxID=32008 RepID=UPI00158BE8BE|nr:MULTISPECIES: DUF6418 domain-containing protein [Burkholderia]MCU9954493.1 DUF6418 domain-containing protein [Burkholderia sp. BKH01]
MRTIRADARAEAALGLTVSTLFVLALTVNAMLPALGAMESSATCTLLVAVAGVIALIGARPVFAVSMLYTLVIGLTAFVAGVGIESGGFLRETDIFGVANGAFSRLLSFYAIFVACALFAFGRLLKERSAHEPIRARMTLQPISIALGLGLVAAILATGVLAGLTGGFAVLSGVNRYALRNDASNSTLFNLFLNNQTFVAVLLGTFCTSSNRMVRWVSVVMIVADLVLEALHGEQFMAVLHVCLTFLIPFIAIHAMNGKPVMRYLGIGSAIALAIGSVSVFYAYKGQGLDVVETVVSRFLEQGQAWYVVDGDAHLFGAPALGGMAAFGRFAASLGSFTEPTFFSDAPVSGLRDLMLSYGTPEILKAYVFDDVTFTMGNMAVPVYWFGYAGGAIFVALTGAMYGAASAMLILVAMRGGVVMLWLTTKIFAYATYAIQQGDYWTLFGARTLFYLLIALIWWGCIDAKRSNANAKRPRIS